MQSVLPGFEEFREVVEADGVSPEEARRVSLEAQRGFQAREDVAWMEDYAALRAEGWPWRVACFIAWATTPRQGREPTTLQGLASVLGLRSARAIRRWRANNPEIDERVKNAVIAPLMAARADIIEALVATATMKDYKSHQDRKLALEMARLYTPRQEVGLEHSGGVHVSADEMAKAKKEVEDWERERFGDGDDDDAGGADDDI